MKRRGSSNLAIKLVALTLVAALGRSLPVFAQAQAKQPNIVYILSDDQGWKDVGYHGSDIKTPNIDKLAAGGAHLEQYYA